MAYPRKVVLHGPRGFPDDLGALLEALRAAEVAYIGIVGVGCERVAEVVDAVCVGDGSGPTWHLLTTAHPDETLEEAVAFARTSIEPFGGDVQVIEL